MRYRRLLCCSILTVLACSPDDPTRDTASTVARILVDSVPLLDIPGTVTPDSSAFLLAAAGLRLDDGRIVIADTYDAAVRYFDASGRLIRKVGRRGGGPGEFESVTGVGRCAADSVFVWGGPRVSVIDTAGRIARSFQIPGSSPIMRCSARSRFAAFSGALIRERIDDDRAAVQLSSTLTIADARGDTLRTLGVFPVYDMRPLRRFTRIAIGGGRVYVGTGDSAYVDVFTLDGQRLPSLAVGIPPRAPTRANYEAAVDLLVRAFPNRGSRESVRADMLTMPMPELMPPYYGLFADPDGTLWVVTSMPGDPVTHLRAIAADGQVVGDVELPIGLEVFDVGRDYVLGAYLDAEGEQHVVLYGMSQDSSANAESRSGVQAASAISVNGSPFRIMPPDQFVDYTLGNP